MIFMTSYKLKAMKRNLIFILIVILNFGLHVKGQNANRERLDSYKIAFFTKKLNLTPQEAEKFWPLYNEYQEARTKIQFERQEITVNFNRNELNMSEREITEAGDRIIALEVGEAKLAGDFHEKIKKILSPVKVMRLYQAENQYRLQLLKELQERRQERNNPVQR